MVREEVAALYPLALEKTVNLEFFYDKDEIEWRGIPQLMPLLVRNLIDNSIKYAPDGGQVRVSLKSVDEAGDASQKISLQIEDNGPGIPESEREAVFERFYRLNSTASGSGLGLAIVGRVAELLGAKIKLATSPEWGGLLVRVDFPLL